MQGVKGHGGNLRNIGYKERYSTWYGRDSEQWAKGDAPIIWQHLILPHHHQPILLRDAINV
jgi:hypothetical protein